MNYTQALSNEQIQSFAPSAFAATPYHAQSNRYAFIPTSDVINGMRQAGLVPVSATQSRCRIADKSDFTKHMIRFRREADLSRAAIVGDTVLEVILVNSHDGTSCYDLSAGAYRFVCTNGMCVPDGVIEALHIRHTGNVVREVVEGTMHIVSQAPKVIDRVTEWKRLLLAPPEQKLLAEAAHSLRFEDRDSPIAQAITPAHLLQARRPADAGADLWSTFNRVQENVIRGGQRGYDHQNLRRVRTREVKGIDQNLTLNRALWTLAEKMAELKRAS